MSIELCSHERGLPSAVVPQQGRDLPLAELDGDVVQGQQRLPSAVQLADAYDADASLLVAARAVSDTAADTLWTCARRYFSLFT